jgi:hypothetical protein
MFCFDRGFPQGVWRRKSKTPGKEKSMSNNNENRVLSRMGARQLSQNEVEEVVGGKLTFASVLLTLPVSNPDESFDQ